MVEVLQLPTVSELVGAGSLRCSLSARYSSGPYDGARTRWARPEVLVSEAGMATLQQYSERNCPRCVLPIADLMAVAFGDDTLSWPAPRSVSGDVDLTLLVKEHAPLLYRLVFSVVRSSSEAEDIVQETFLRALQQGDKLHRLDSVRSWLLRVAWNLAMDRKRRGAPAQLPDELALAIASREIPQDQRLSLAADLALVLTAIEALPESERAVLLMAAFDELSVTEIANALGKSTSSVRSLTFRARTHLREELQRTMRSKAVSTLKRRPNHAG